MLIYDGDCGFCTRCAEWARERLRLGWEVVPFQEIPDLSKLGLTKADAQSKVWWIGADGRPVGGHRAAARCLMAMGKKWSPLAAVLLIPPFSWLAAAVYWVVSVNRHRLPGGSAACETGQTDAISGSAPSSARSNARSGTL